MVKNRTARWVTASGDDPYETGFRAALHDQPCVFGASTPARLREYQAGYNLGASERRRALAAQARQAMPLSRDEYARAFLRGAVQGQRSGVTQFGASDPRVVQAYAAGFRATQAGQVLIDRAINWRSGWGVVPLTADPGSIRALARALDTVR